MVDYTSENLTTPTTFNDLGKSLTTPKIVLKNQLKICCVAGPQGVDQ